MSTALAAVTEAMPQFQRIAQKNPLVVWEKESQFATQAIQKNSKLQACIPRTIQDAVINVAAIGLTLNPADKYAYLVPEYNKELSGNECQLRISYVGLIKIATDTGAIKWAKAEVVKENDVFEYLGPCAPPKHSMNPFDERGATIGVYCIAKTNEDDFLVDVMDRATIDQIRKCAKFDTVWNSWFDEMAKKAIIKRASKQWPKTEKSSALHEAIQVINKAEGSDFDNLQHLQDTADYIIEHIGKEDELAVGEAWCEATDEEKRQLWVAKSKGGFFTQEQKKYIRVAILAYKQAGQVIEGELAGEIS